MSTLDCPKCGYHLSPFDKVCPRCAQQDDMPKAPRGTRFRDNAPLAPAPGQELEADSFAYIRGVVKADPWFGVLLGILALWVILAILGGDLFRIVIDLVIFWGVLNRHYWGYVVAIIFAWVGLVGVVAGFIQNLMSNRSWLAGLDLFSWPGIFFFATNLLTIIILSLRRKDFV